MKLYFNIYTKPQRVSRSGSSIKSIRKYTKGFYWHRKNTKLKNKYSSDNIGKTSWEMINETKNPEYKSEEIKLSWINYSEPTHVAD